MATINACYSPECCCSKHDTFGLCPGGIHTHWSHTVHILNQYSCLVDMCLILHCTSHCLVWTPLEDNVHCCQFDILKKIKGTVSQTAHVQVINLKWSDVFKFVICETKWRQQAEDNPHSHGGRRSNPGRKQFF